METWKLITDRMTALKDLHDRMDKTKKLVYPDDYPFQLKNFKGHKMDNVINVTGNQPIVFATAIISDLMGAKWQTSVEGKVTSRQAHVIEGFIEDNLAQADEMLLNKFGLAGLYAWLCNHVCIRSLIGVRWLSQVQNGEYAVDCLPTDMRWTPFQFGKDGLEWVAPITWCSSDELISELEGQEGVDVSKIPKNKKALEVRDYWGREKNELLVEKQLIRTQPNPFSKPPFVIVFPPAGFMLRDKGYLKHEAEDLFFLNRGLYEELNRSLSIEQSIGMDILYPPYEQETDNLTAEPAQPPPKTGETIKVKKGERHVPVPRGDLNRASMIARQDIQRMIEIGGPILPRAYTQPPSAVEVQTEIELLAKWHYPRKLALQMFREQLVRMMIDQFILSAGKEGSEKTSLLIGRRGRKSQYSVGQLGDPDSYDISCTLTTRSKRQEVANWAMANAAWGKAPRRAIFRDILGVEDPDGWESELDLQKAKEADEAIALFEMARRYAQEAAKIEDESESDALKIQSKMLTERGVAVIRQRQQPTPTQLPEKARVPQVEEPTKGQELMPLLGRTGGRGSPVTAPEEE